MFAWLNGEWVDKEKPVIQLEDRGFTFGDGLFEVCRILKFKPLFFREHLDRMIQSAEFFKIPIPYSKEEIYQVVRSLAKKNDVETGEVYFELTRGKDANREHRIRPQNLKPTFFILVLPLREINPKNWQNGAQVYLYPDKRHGFCDHKTLNLFANVLAKNFANDKGGYEALMYRKDNKGIYITEGGSSTFFAFQNNTLCTPKIENILPGVTRRKIFEIAKTLKINSEEKRVYLKDLLLSEEVFIASTVSKVMPVKFIEKRSFRAPGKITSLFMKHLDDYIQEDVSNQV